MFVGPARCLRSASAPPDPIDRVKVDEVKMEFLYNDGEDYYFMDESFEADGAETRDAGRCGGVQLPICRFSSFHDAAKAVGIELPTYVEMTVMKTEPGIKSTASV